MFLRCFFLFWMRTTLWPLWAVFHFSSRKKNACNKRLEISNYPSRAFTLFCSVCSRIVRRAPQPRTVASTLWWPASWAPSSRAAGSDTTPVCRTCGPWAPCMRRRRKRLKKRKKIRAGRESFTRRRRRRMKRGRKTLHNLPVTNIKWLQQGSQLLKDIISAVSLHQHSHLGEMVMSKSALFLSLHVCEWNGFLDYTQRISFMSFERNRFLSSQRISFILCVMNEIDSYSSSFILMQWKCLLHQCMVECVFVIVH